ncbi:hypothetical protein [Streptomyces sp. NPDC051561]|uniref:hypothetical protein n=1 Tax=Streptomyces sp. NPDC051561 TaxID=3365658 RepID=UPI00379F33BC
MINNEKSNLFSSLPHEPGVEWLEHLDADPVKALEMFVHAWYPAGIPEKREPTAEDAVPDADLPPALAALAGLVRHHPGLSDFSNPLMPAQVRGPRNDRLVFATENQGTSHWAITWPLTGEADQPVWRIDDP